MEGLLSTGPTPSSLPIMPLVPLAIPAQSPAIPALSLAIPALSLAILVHPCSLPGCPWYPLLSRGYPWLSPVGQEDSVAAFCSLSLFMVEAGSKLQLTGIKVGLVLITMASMTLQILLLSSKMIRSYGLTDLVGNP